MPKYVILEYGTADGTLNPFNYDPYASYPQLEKRPLTDQEYFSDTVTTRLGVLIPTPMSIVSCRHMSEIVGTIKKYRQFDFEIVSLPYMYAEEYLEANKADIFVLSGSVGGFLNDGFLEKYKDDFYMVASAGNEGAAGEGLSASKPYWTVVGAVDPNLQPSEYSSWGKGLVQFVGITDENIRYSYLGQEFTKFLRGTSFAGPQHGTEIMNLMMAYFDKTGSKPAIKTVLKIRDENIKDVFTPGKDLRTGYGIFQYSDKAPIPDQIVLKAGRKSARVNGVDVPLDVAPINISGRTLVPLRFIAETLGVVVEYNPTTQEITLIK